MTDLTEQLKEKIKSKMDVAKYFTGFISISISLAINKLTDHAQDSDVMYRVPVAIGLFLILSSLALSVATMYAYDRLLMPIKFWTVPPTDIDEILHKEMIKAWRWLFMPTVFTLFGSLICFIVPFVTDISLIIGLLIVPILVTLVYLNYSTIGKKIHG